MINIFHCIYRIFHVIYRIFNWFLKLYITFCFSNIKLVNNCFLHGNNCSLGGNNRQYLPFNITPYVNKCRAPYVSVYYPRNPWVNIFEISIFTFVKALYLLLRRLILETTKLKGGGKLNVYRSNISITWRRIIEIFSASSWVIATYKTFIPAPAEAGAIILRREPADNVKFSLGRTLKN